MNENERNWQKVIREFPWIWHLVSSFNLRHAPPRIYNGEILITSCNGRWDHPCCNAKLWLYEVSVDRFDLREVDVDSRVFGHIIIPLWRACTPVLMPSQFFRIGSNRDISRSKERKFQRASVWSNPCGIMDKGENLFARSASTVGRAFFCKNQNQRPDLFGDLRSGLF